MPNIVSPISQLHWTVERPVVFEIARQIMAMSGISSKTPITFYGDEEKTSQAGSTVESTHPENKWPYDERVYIEVSEDYDPDSLGSTAVTRIEHPAYIQDDLLGLNLRPVYVRTILTISFKYRARDKAQAVRWRNERRIKTSQMQECMLHDLTYHYCIPTDQLEIVKEIYRLRENVAGYGQSYNDYLTGIANRNVGLVTNQAMSDAAWVVNENQVRVVGIWDYTGVPEKAEKEGDADTWSVTFSHKVEYHKPIGSQIRYPLIVHNQLIGEDYRPGPVKVIENYQARRSISGEYMKGFETDSRAIALRGDTGVTLPEFDDWIPKSILPSTVRVFTAVSLVDTASPRTLFNLEDLGEYQLIPEILDWIRQQEWRWMGKDYQSILSLTLYKDLTQLSSDSISVDANLNVTAAVDMDPRHVYHVRLGLVTNFNYLATPALQRLQGQAVSHTLVRVINTSMRSLNASRRDIRDLQIPDLDARSILGKTVNLQLYRGGNMWTVETLFVNSARATPVANAAV